MRVGPCWQEKLARAALCPPVQRRRDSWPRASKLTPAQGGFQPLAPPGTGVRLCREGQRRQASGPDQRGRTIREPHH